MGFPRWKFEFQPKISCKPIRISLAHKFLNQTTDFVGLHRNRPCISARSTTLAPPVGLEPTTYRLTADRSTIELWRNILFQKPPEPAARKLLISSSSECHPTSILQTPFLLTGTFRNLRSCLRQPSRPLLSAFVPSGFCSFRDFRNKRVGETKVSPTQWNPATTYPPGPFPAKYYQRVEA